MSLIKVVETDGKIRLDGKGGSTLSPDERELSELVTSFQQELGYPRSAATKLEEIIDKIVGDNPPLAPSEGLKQIRSAEHNFENTYKSVKKSAFAIFALDVHGKRIPDPGPLDHIYDIEFHTEDVPISDDRVNFKVEIDRAMTVVNSVFIFRSGIDRGEFLKRIIGRRGGASHKEVAKRAKYLAGLKRISHVGLEHEDASQLKLARQSLDAFREDFVANEAGTIKNRYLWRLGLLCLLVALATGLAYYFVRQGAPPQGVQPSVPYAFRNFLLLIPGACVGIWLSFALRRGTLSFQDLAALEEDRLDPVMRVLFVVGLTSVVGLLLWTKAVTFGVGNFTTQDFYQHGATALLVGLLLGIAERTMATAVQKRASEFTGAIGGK